MSSEIRPQTHYSEQTFNQVHLEAGELASCEFYDCKFIQCTFVECVFRNCRVVNCTFHECDISLAHFPGVVFANTRFEDSKAIGVDWTRADWTAIRLGDPIGFYNCALNHSIFIGLSLKGMQVRDCMAIGVDFREADLSQADFGGSDLGESIFINTNLSEADLSKARNYQIKPGQNNLKKAKFSLPEALSLLYDLDIIVVEEVE